MNNNSGFIMDNISYEQFNIMLDNFKKKTYSFLNDDLKLSIKTSIQLLFPNIHNDDSEILYLFTENLIEKISQYMYFKNEEKYYLQWKQNNYRDIKGIILILIPYIDDKKTTEMTDLNQFLYSKITKHIPNYILEQDRNEILKTDFKFSNMAIGLLNGEDNILNLFEKDDKMKLIYKIIHHNYIGLLRTLEIMNGKYYINWINIVPILLEDYKESEIYKKTIEGINKYISIINQNDTIKSDFTNDYYGLWFGNIYNTIKIKLYDEIKNIKFLIFTYKFDDNTNIYLINHLNNIFNIQLFFTFEKYDDLDEIDKNIFSKVLLEQITEIRSNANIFDIWKQILLFLCNDYSNRFVVENENKTIFNKFSFIPIKSDTNFSDDNKEEEYNNIILEKLQNLTLDDLIQFINNINHKHIWNFLQESIKKLEGTYLKEYLIKDGRISNEYFLPNTKLSFKNIYNIAKSMTHYILNDKWVTWDVHYISFNQTDQNSFMKRFLGISNEWLNLRKNIIREYGNINYTGKINEIISDWDKIKLDLIFEILIKNGVLNKFEVDLELTDKKRIGDGMKKKIGLKFKNNPNYKKAYYYLTNDRFEKLNKIRFENSKTKNKEELNYFELLITDQLWYSFYAMDWLAQINFFHHYINHRIMLVTGATGQGKSTQVPKLLIYALKAFDFKNNGKVVCTQPRIPPTTGNSERISEELGLPINQISHNPQSKDKVRTNNFYVQMKHSMDSHVKKNCPHLTLKILTDGTLLEELKQNPLLKEITEKNKKTDYIYGFNNFYDIVILDESHEHNTNMDLILTLMKQSCLYNNSLRLIIMSATMDEDEPIYRSYFKNINDNLVYPIKAPLYKHPILNLPENKMIPDTIYMDRRFHISPPGETTQYIVTENYITDISYDEMDDTIASKKIQELSYTKVKEICSQFVTGEILLFSTGEAEIKSAVENLNKILPPGNVALPYFSKLNQKYKEIVEKIDKKIYSIRNKREKIYEEWGPDYIEDKTVPEGVYQRAIIVATNVAEASVTIPRLKFVIDNGYAKVNIYDPKKELSILQVEKISEASRVQRKGRVGRLSDGVVYFLYPKGGREKILPKYKITQEDPSNLFINLTRDDDDFIDKNKANIIISRQFDPNLLTSQFYTPNISTNVLKTPFYTKNIYNILVKQYSRNSLKIDPTLYWNEKYFSINTMDQFSNYRTYTGQYFDNVVDVNGIFYIIHPFENLIKRNINNDIIKFNELKITKIPKLYFNQIFDLLKQTLIIVNINDKPNLRSEDIILTDYTKTTIYQKINLLQKSLNSKIIDVHDCLTIFASIGLDCFNEVLAVLIMVKTISLPSSNKAINKNFYNKWGNNQELIILYNIFTSLKLYFGNLLIFKIIENPKELNKYNDLIADLIKKFKKEIVKNPLDIPTSFKNDTKYWNDLNKLYSSGNLENSKGQKEMKYIIINNIINEDIDKNQFKIKEWANNNFLEYESLKEFLNIYGDTLLNILTLERNLDIELNEVSPLVWINEMKSNFIKILKTGEMKERIIKSFIIGRPYNYAIKINSSNNYYNLSLGDIKAYITKDKYNQNTSSSLIFFYDYSNLKEENKVNLNFVNNVEIEYFTSCLPHIFNKQIFRNIVNVLSFKYSNKQYQEIYNVSYFKGDIYDMIIHYIKNNSGTSSPWESELLPALNMYFKNLRKQLMLID